MFFWHRQFRIDEILEVKSFSYLQIMHLELSLAQGSYSSYEIKFQDIPVYSRMEITKFPGLFWLVYHTSEEINMLSTIYFGVFCDDGHLVKFVTKLMYYK